MPTFTETLSGSANDAQEAVDSSGFSSTGTSIIMTAAPSGQDFNRTCGGFRFTNVTVAYGSLITAADIQFYSSGDPIAGADDPKFDIYCEAADNSVDFATTLNVVSRTRTSNSTFWSATNIGTGTYKTSPDISTVVQEVINRVGWASGNALTVICIPRASGGSEQFNCYAADKGNGLYAILDITSNSPYAGPTGKPIVVRQAPQRAANR